MTEDILWYINSLKRDRRKLTPQQRLEISAEFIDSMIEIRRKKNVQGVRNKSDRDFGE